MPNSRSVYSMRPSVKFVDEYDPDSPFISSNESSVPSGNGIKVNNNAVNDASASDSRIEEIAVRPWKKRKLTYLSMSDNIKKSFEEVPPSTIPWATQAARSSPGVFESGQQPSSVQISKQTYTYVLPVPSRAEIVRSLEDYGLPMKIYRDPWYSNATDAPDRPREFAGLVYHLKGGNGLDVLSDWITDGGVETASGACAQPSPLLSLGVTGWEYANHPPSKLEVKKWVAKSGSTSHRCQQRSQV
jgi:DNA polymerase zeta